MTQKSMAKNSTKTMRAAISSLLMGTILAMSAPTQANVATRMNGFFGAMGGAANVSGPSAFQGQSAGYYTLGNVYIRTPVQNQNFANIQLPSYRAGCGGIDLFAGGFSFINADQLVALMKNIANNSISFAFKVGIDTLCPSCGNIISDLQDQVNKINQFAMNSCDAAQTAVGSLWQNTGLADRQFCENIGRQGGIYTDAVAAKFGCGVNNETAATNASASGAEKENSPADPRNYTWHAMQKSDFFKDGGAIDREFAEYVMSLVGTLIYAPENGGNPSTIKVIPGNPDLVDVLMDGSTVMGNPVPQYHACDETTLCLNPALANLSIDSDDTVKARVDQFIADIIAKIQTDTALTAGEQNLLNLVTLPLYKILTVETAYTRGIGLVNSRNVAEIAAAEIVFAIVDQVFLEVSTVVDTIPTTEHHKFERWQDGLKKVRDRLQNRKVDVADRTKATMAVLERINAMEAVLSSELNPGIMAAYTFSKRSIPSAMLR